MKSDGRDDEFAIIRDLFAPLTDKTKGGTTGAFNLRDDVAVLNTASLVVTKDLMIAGVHFREKDQLDLVARKLMRVNISDLVAKAVRPAGYMLGCVWPLKTNRPMIEKFVQGLHEDQALFKCHLFGGDTTRHKLATAPLTLSATFYGAAPQGGIVPRGGAKPGDDVYVTGTIGDAGLGLKVLEGRYKPAKEHKDYLMQRYWLPEPRVTFGSALKSFATASLDVSDGLMADAGHLADCSEVGITIKADDLPLSDAACGWFEKQDDPTAASGFLASCGDDYEILFTAPLSLRRSVAMAAKASRTEVTRIGTITRDKAIVLVDSLDQPIDTAVHGFNHF